MSAPSQDSTTAEALAVIHLPAEQASGSVSVERERNSDRHVLTPTITPQ